MSIYVISGKHKGRKIETPARRETRPATSLLRGMVFDSCQTIIQDANVLDLFAGSGAMGIEALSRGAGFVLFNDLSGECNEAIRKNLLTLDEVKKAQVFQTDAFSLLESISDERKYDLVLLHPPYPIGIEGYTRLILLLSTKLSIVADDGVIFLEIPGKLQKELTPLIEKHFSIKKCKSRSTWALFTLLKTLP